MGLGPTELIIVLVIVLLLFGGAKLPKLAKSLGEAQREFTRGTNGEREDLPVVEDAGVETTVVEETVVRPAAQNPTVGTSATR